MDDPTTPDDFRAGMTQAIERYREMQQQTKNPMYFWLALQAANDLRQFEARSGPSDQPLVLPSWCADYFGEVAWDFGCLAGGMDLAREGVAGEDYPKLTADAAMRLVPQALGFTRRGYSAFDQFQATFELMQVFQRYENLRTEGKASAEALDLMMSELGVEEERTIRRRIAAGRRFVKGDQPEDEDTTDKT